MYVCMWARYILHVHAACTTRQADHDDIYWSNGRWSTPASHPSEWKLSGSKLGSFLSCTAAAAVETRWEPAGNQGQVNRCRSLIEASGTGGNVPFA